MTLLRLLLEVLSAQYGARLRTFIRLEVIAAALGGIAFVLIVPTLDALLREDTGEALTWLLIALAVVVAYAVVGYRAKALGYEVGSTVSRGLHRRIGHQVVRLPLGWFDGTRQGPMGQLASKGVVDVMGVPAHLARALIVAVVTPGTLVIGMFFFDWRLALAALLTLPMLVLTAQITGALVKKADARLHAARSEANSRIIEFSTHQPVLRAFGRSVEGDERLDDALVEQRDASRNLLVTVVPGMTGFIAAIQIAFGVVFVIGTNLALGGDVGVAELVALLVLTVRFVEPLIVAADLMGALRLAESSLGRMAELLAEPTLPEPTDPVLPVSSEIEFRDVTFGYETDRPILTGVDLRAQPGTVTALVGVSGSGKTTITRLIARFWDVDHGSVRIGGADVRELTTETLMNQLSLVFQDVYLFDGTILENIRLGRTGATDDEVIAAGRAARVDEIVERLPHGWQTQVGEGGTNLSGGERQRVSIARAILKDAPIVLLDEATAALDPANEVLVTQALRALSADKTVIVIAHRLQTVRHADQILVLGDGEIRERGTHEELVDLAGGRYAAFWERREAAQGWRLAATGESV
ncbi:MAG: ABC transporter ATP-binding protein [Actinomycetota bacterium]